MAPENSNFGRRDFLQMTGAGIVAASAGATSTQSLASDPSAVSESSARVASQPAPEFGPDLTTADIMVETLISWGATHCFGMVGDGINSIMEALRKRQDQIKYIGVRHEEAAAFMASGFAKHTGKLGVCVGTTGPARCTFSTASTTQHGRLAGCRDYGHDVPRSDRNALPAGRRHHEANAGRGALQCRSDRPGTCDAGDEPRLPGGAR